MRLKIGDFSQKKHFSILSNTFVANLQQRKEMTVMTTKLFSNDATVTSLGQVISPYSRL